MGFISILKLHIRLTFPLHSTVRELSQGMWAITGTEDSEGNGAQGGPLPAWKTDFNYKKKKKLEFPYSLSLISAWLMFVVTDNSLKNLKT